MPFTIIGYVGKSYGLGGKFYLSEQKVNAEALRSLKYVYVGNGVEPDDVYTLTSVEDRGARVCIGLETVDSREKAHQLTHQAVFITDKQAEHLHLEVDTDYTGYHVYQDGRDLGEVTDVLRQPAQDIITFTTMNGSEVMVPLVDEFIDMIDDDKRILHVHLLEGMLDED